MMRSTTSGSSEPAIKIHKVKFFSKAGKVYLSRIWEDQHLSDEMLVSSWISGSLSDSIVKENVSDYMQHYLQDRYIRFGSPNTCEHFQYHQHQTTRNNGNLSIPRRRGVASIQEYNLFKERTYNREMKENERLRKFVLEGKLEPTSSDFKDILKHPVFRANCTEARIKKIEELYYNNSYPYFHEISSQIKNLERSLDVGLENCKNELTSPIITFSSKNASTLDSSVTQCESLYSEESNKPKLNAMSISSGFQEMSPSPIILEETLQDKALLTLSLNENITDTKVGSLGQNKSSIDEKVKTCNSITSFAVYDTSDCRQYNNNNTPWISPFIHFILEEENTSDMYKLADEVLRLFRRKLYASKQLVEEIIKRAI